VFCDSTAETKGGALIALFTSDFARDLGGIGLSADASSSDKVCTGVASIPVGTTLLFFDFCKNG
jgi:hypothetical protein